MQAIRSSPDRYFLVINAAISVYKNLRYFDSKVSGYPRRELCTLAVESAMRASIIGARQDAVSYRV